MMDTSKKEIINRANFLIYDYLKKQLHQVALAEDFKKHIQNSEFKDIILFKGLDDLMQILTQHFKGRQFESANGSPPESNGRAGGEAIAEEKEEAAPAAAEQLKKSKKKKKKKDETQSEEQQQQPVTPTPTPVSPTDSGKKSKKIKKQQQQQQQQEEKAAAAAAATAAAADAAAASGGEGEATKKRKKKNKKKKTKEEEEVDAEAVAATKEPVAEASNGAAAAAAEAADAAEAEAEEEEEEAQQQASGQKRQLDDGGEGGCESKKQKRHGQPYRRVREEEVENRHFQDNSFDAKPGSRGSWGYKANLDLKPTQGKSFRHEKTKKKRGSYKGGAIDTGVSSMKFESEDDDE